MIQCFQVSARLPLELLETVVHQDTVEITAAQLSAYRDQGFVDRLIDREDGHVESAATKVENEDRALLDLGLVAERDRCGGWFVQQAETLESCYLRAFQSGEPLLFREVGWHCDHTLTECLCVG